VLIAQADAIDLDAPLAAFHAEGWARLGRVSRTSMRLRRLRKRISPRAH
jgi:hypothetical protein